MRIGKRLYEYLTFLELNKVFFLVYILIFLSHKVSQLLIHCKYLTRVNLGDQVRTIFWHIYIYS